MQLAGVLDQDDPVAGGDGDRERMRGGVRGLAPRVSTITRTTARKSD
jgi:hypothetical protein